MLAEDISTCFLKLLRLTMPCRNQAVPVNACSTSGSNVVLSPGLLRQIAAGAAARRPLWQLRAQMAHFIAHFTSYLQARFETEL